MTSTRFPCKNDRVTLIILDKLTQVLVHGLHYLKVCHKGQFSDQSYSTYFWMTHFSFWKIQTVVTLLMILHLMHVILTMVSYWCTWSMILHLLFVGLKVTIWSLIQTNATLWSQEINIKTYEQTQGMMKYGSQVMWSFWK